MVLDLRIDARTGIGYGHLNQIIRHEAGGDSQMLHC